MRIPDEGALLDALRPELDRRLASAGLDRTGDEVVICTYARHHRMAVTPEGLGPVRTGGTMQDPTDAGATAVAPDALATALLGSSSLHDLSATRPDVAPGPGEDVDRALFPRLTADVLTYYLPW
ncbi:hypothetical protein [Cellulomonas bogoriensis]|uniref:Uncharacterized protein n=1 Tax=Cellulomonas bogoriensis 69B4 = DSM 16987 TaxID=1386082 RepID=A0A0A0C0V4_9CELL|nr:hypothetical protein [Cellulomonas bogoriensis]KGM13054.1 hypothetical protein N869_16420 [Cellulomonas bogoriensis 69B4 = DSM 16987]